MGSAKQTHAGAKAPNPFVERSDVNAPSAHMTNPLDEQLQLILSKKRSARCWSQASAVSKSHRDYVFTPPDVEERIRQTVGHSLSGCAIGQKATSSTDLASLQVLRERYLEPYLTTQSQYRAHLERQASGAPVSPRACAYSFSQANQGRREITSPSSGCI